MIPLPAPLSSALELDAALLQAAVSGALAALTGFLYRRYRKPYLAWWTAAWLLYVVRIGAIISFLVTANRSWLYWHQAITGWVALTVLWSALVFSRQLRWRRWYLLAALFPPLWSYVAIYQLDDFLLAAGPMVLFLSGATLWSGWVFVHYHRRVSSSGAVVLAVALILWGLHHLDYPFLRAQGAWAPWGYYLDIIFELAVGCGIVLLVLDDLARGLKALSDLSGDLQRGALGHALDPLLERPLSLPAVRGSALYLADPGRVVGAAGVCAAWVGAGPPADALQAVADVVAEGRPRMEDGLAGHTYGAVLPIFRGPAVSGALILVGDARDPFTALDDGFLVALGQQVGAALENADLYRRLEARRRELERLSARMVAQHEEERRRLSRELHDESAQVLSALKMELGVLRDGSSPAATEGLDRALELVDTGIRSIRGVVNDLRPSLLDDLGLLPALRSLIADFTARSGLRVSLDAPDALPPLSNDAELALYRALQEALSNIVRHAGATAVDVVVTADAGAVALTVSDDGRGLESGGAESLERGGRMGLAGMRERIGALGGDVRLGPGTGAGLMVAVRVPVGEPRMSPEARPA